MTTACLLAIDQGTTSTRAILFGADGRPLAIARRELPQIYPRDGWVEHDGEEIWRAVLDACREVLAKAEADVAASRMPSCVPYSAAASGVTVGLNRAA